jgi:arylsulfatase A-like enzyme
MWGEHGREKKNCAFEECARLPMVVRHPRAVAGSVESAFVQTTDLFPTFLALAGAEIPSDVDGTSFAGLLDGSDPEWPRDAVFVECWPKGHVFAAVRTGAWKYVEYYDDIAQTQPLLRADGTAERELYDMREDPFELDNLLRLSAQQLDEKGWSPDALAEIVAELDARLTTLQSE